MPTKPKRSNCLHNNTNKARSGKNLRVRIKDITIRHELATSKNTQLGTPRLAFMPPRESSYRKAPTNLQHRPLNKAARPHVKPIGRRHASNKLPCCQNTKAKPRDSKYTQSTALHGAPGGCTFVMKQQHNSIQRKQKPNTSAACHPATHICDVSHATVPHSPPYTHGTPTQHALDVSADEPSRQHCREAFYTVDGDNIHGTRSQTIQPSGFTATGRPVRAKQSFILSAGVKVWPDCGQRRLHLQRNNGSRTPQRRNGGISTAEGSTFFYCFRLLLSMSTLCKVQ